MPDIAMKRKDRSQWFCTQIFHQEQWRDVGGDNKNNPHMTMLIDY